MHSRRDLKRPSTMTYGRLAQAMGYPDRQAGITLARQLGIIGEYCKMNDIPSLNAIIVNQETGEPGSGVVLRDAGERQAGAGGDHAGRLVPLPRHDALPLGHWIA
jgi:hypothetical protein